MLGRRPAADDHIADIGSPREDRGERLDHRVDPLVTLKPRDGHQPTRAVREPGPLPQGARLHSLAKAPRIGAEMHDAKPFSVTVEAQLAEQRQREVAGPSAVRHEHRGTAEDDLGRASLERRLADLVLLAQQVAAVQIDPVRDAAALEHPAGWIPRRLDVPAVDETHATLAGQTRGPPRPKKQAGQRLGAAGPGGGAGGHPPPPPGRLGPGGGAPRRGGTVPPGEKSGGATRPPRPAAPPRGG